MFYIKKYLISNNINLLQIIDVVICAINVPLGIEPLGSIKSPLLLHPAKIPVTDGKNIPINIKNDVLVSLR